MESLSVLTKRPWLVFGVLALVVTSFAAPMMAELSKNYSTSRAQLNQAKIRLQQTRELQLVIEAERADRRALEKIMKQRGQNFDLYSYTNQRVRSLSLQSKAKLSSKGLTFTGGRMQAVELVLTDVAKNELVDLLHQLYDGKKLVTLQRLNHLKPSRSGKGVDCQLTLVAPKVN